MDDRDGIPQRVPWSRLIVGDFTAASSFVRWTDHTRCSSVGRQYLFNSILAQLLCHPSQFC